MKIVVYHKKEIILGLTILIISITAILITDLFSRVNSVSTSLLVLFVQFPILLFEVVVFGAKFFVKKKTILKVINVLLILSTLIILYWTIDYVFYK